MRQVYIAGELCDLKQDESFGIEKSISDAKDPSKRLASRSSTIKVLGTARMNNLFGFLFVPNKDNNFNTFNPKVKIPAYVTDNGYYVLEGFAQLLSIQKSGNEVVYEVVIYSNEKSLFALMGDNFITGNETSANDIDLSVGSNVVTLSTTGANQSFTDSFVTTSAVCAPFYIENGLGTTQPNFPYYNIDFRQTRLAVKFRHIWDRIFAKHGQSYSSTFITSSAFSPYCYLDTHKSLPKLGATSLNNLTSRVGRNSDTSSINYTTSGQVPINVEYFDPNNNFFSNVFTAPETRKYRVKAYVLYQAGTLFTLGKLAGSSTYSHNVSIRVVKNGVVQSTRSRTDLHTVTAAQTSGALVYANSGPIQFDFEIDLAAGDTLSFNYIGTFTNSTPSTAGAEGRLRFLNGLALTFEPAVNEITVGNTYPINSVPATKHKQKDFVLDIIRMFNMLVLYDEETSRYIIEPRDTFYSSRIYDITNVVDRSSPITINPIGELIWNELKLTYTPDKDYYHDLYVKNNGEVYGEQNVYNDNEFATEKQEVKIDMSSPILVSQLWYYPKLQHIYTFNGSTRQAIDGRQRFGYWAGWKDLEVYYDYISAGGVLGITTNGYPLVGEFNDLNNPTVSAIFGSPREIFYQSVSPVAITSNNHYKYFENQIENQVDLNAKIIKCTVVSPDIIAKLKLNDKVLFDGVLCTISNISVPDDGRVNLELVQYER